MSQADDAGIVFDRRSVIAGVGAAMVGSRAAIAQPSGGEPPVYDYVFLNLGAGPRPAFLTHLRTVVRPLLVAAGGEMVGMFSPQLGWRSTETALLVRWRGAASQTGALAAITEAPQVSGRERHRLAPTTRPSDSERPASGGIYVHRWFDVAAASAPEFISLSEQGWRDFEARFATRIFGLFTVARTADDERAGIVRLLLITRYASHGVWEESRDPSTEAMTIFARRQQLTKGSRAASSVFSDPFA